MSSKPMHTMKFESLEDRRLMAASIELSKVGHNNWLWVQGTDDADLINIQEVTETIDYSFFNPRTGRMMNYSVDVEKIEATIRGADGSEILSETFNASAIDRIWIYGYGGSDEIFNNTSKQSDIRGGAGDDLIVGGSGTDTIHGDLGRNLLFGREGNDRLYVSTHAGADTVDGAEPGAAFGGEGDDRLYGSSFLSFSFDDVFNPPQDDVLVGGSGSDTIYGYSGSDFIVGDKLDENWWPGSDVWTKALDMGFASPSNDNGQDGNDSIRAGAGVDQIWGGDGNDTIRAEAGDDIVYAERGDDAVLGGDGNDLIYGDFGEDTVRGGAGSDTIYGGAHADELHGDDDSDLIFGGNGGDFIAGGDGWDVLWGEEGHNTIIFTLDDPLVDGLPSFLIWRYIGAGHVVAGEYTGHLVRTT